MTTVPVMLPASAGCVLHKRHSPRPMYLEFHHVVPQGWQKTWAPKGASTEKLWRPDGVAACATGHRNLHWILVRAMKEIGKGATLDEAMKLAVRGVRHAPTEAAFARRAMVEFQAAGGDLLHLCAERQYGYA